MKLNPLNLIPAPWRILAGVIAVALVLGATFSAGLSIGADGVQDKWDDAKFNAVMAARRTERAWSGKYQEAANARTQAENQLAVARANAAAAGQRLRVATDEWQRRLSEATVETCRAAASTAADLLGQCGERYRLVAAAADGHLADLRQCEAAWPE